MSKILLTTFGSYGDLHPYIAMGKILKERGHHVTLATLSQYQLQVERVGLNFVAVKPGVEEMGPEETWIDQANHPERGAEFVIKKFILPHTREIYPVLKNTAAGSDLIISHPLTFVTPIVAEELGIRWLSVALQPSIFFSAYDPSPIGPLWFLAKLKFLGPGFHRSLLGLISNLTQNWWTQIAELRTEIGLKPLKKHPLFQSFSNDGTLALFPSAFGTPQPDWPERTELVGFPLYDQETTATLSDPLVRFLEVGPAPLVFTLGSSIVLTGSDFFEIAYQAVKKLGVRAVFLVGKKSKKPSAEILNDPNILVSEYEPFSALFLKCSIVIHQCGVGTTAQALASGKPQVLVPFAHDQPDNARRVAALGLGVVVPAAKLSVLRLERALSEVLEAPSYAQKASEFAKTQMQNQFEDTFVKAIGRFLGSA